MECPHLGSSVGCATDSPRFPNGTPSSWCCNVCRSNKSPWICLTCLMVHCGRYVNGHAKKHFEDSQGLGFCQKKGDKQEKDKNIHSACMDCCNLSVFCYKCDEFVVNDTKLGYVQKLREHLQRLENAVLLGDRQRKRKFQESPAGDGKLLKDNDELALGATGLRNLGNTCFMNAILQSLSNIEQFSCYFKELPAVALRSGKTAGRRMYHTRSQGDSSVSLVEEFRKTLCSLWQGNQTAFSPDSLFYTIWKIMPSFRGYQQQDAHEFMRYLLDHLHRELQYSRNGAFHPVSPQDRERLSSTDGKCCINGPASVVTSIFGGILQNEVNCLICGTESRKFDPFLDLSLDIPSQFRQKRSKDQEPGLTCTLRDCLRSFTDLEELDETELYYCHKCKKRQKSTKKFWVQKLPKVLCLHLKRFHWTAFLRNKVDTYVEFPLKGLDMRGYLLEPENSLPGSCLYDLVAVVVHHGSGVGSGHYTAYGSHEGHWYHFNDSTVTLTNEDTVRKAKAYILFYVVRVGQVDADETTDSMAAETLDVDAAAMDSVQSEQVSQDSAPADATETALMDGAPTQTNAAHEKSLRNTAVNTAEVNEADTVLEEVVTVRDTGTEEVLQSVPPAAP
ncbi:ubiquitin carboxyl-terminal hydrolase 3 isoform X2 [Nothobranchius furzeri]|uniref:Ubiquitin carboxyl-terminal hydrolase n=1 Tax=Nothobranchius furzeri TaxID=105023 RepID=A0A1A8UTR6_NOTFU|nr:ubiquitin carboxyl-terminal hydrolase 3 isoform X2 [Nothobranchius furzeri]KAF7224397.1 ubiquitin specific peptidase 3 [Nothobranchius furzeri]